MEVFKVDGNIKLYFKFMMNKYIRNGYLGRYRLLPSWIWLCSCNYVRKEKVTRHKELEITVTDRIILENRKLLNET